MRPNPKPIVVAALLGLALSSVAVAQSLPALRGAAEIDPYADAPRPAGLAERAGVEPLASLRPAREVAIEQLDAIAEWNRSGRRPVKVGFERPLAVPRRVHVEAQLAPGVDARLAGGVATRAADGAVLWATEIRVADAHRFRVRLDDVMLPAGSVAWVSDPSGSEATPFGRELIGPDGTLWTPSVGGGRMLLEVRVPADAGDEWGFAVAAVGELFELDPEGRPLAGGSEAELEQRNHDDCLRDANCIGTGEFGAINDAQNAVGKYVFFDGPFAFVCSGALINNSAFDGTPYFWTANHCISTNAEASSIEVLWRATTTTCDGNPIPDGQLDRSNGATLRATNSKSDFTLLELDDVPGGLTLLGWNANAGAVSNNTRLHRVHHPAPHEPQLPQSYSRTRNDSSPDFTCSGVSTNNYYYHALESGGTFHGSSGAPIMLNDGAIVGQELGACGLNTDDGCDGDNNYEVDGRFNVSFRDVERFLDPEVTADCPAGYVTDPNFPDFCFRVVVNPPGLDPFPGNYMDPSLCLAETVCYSGALPDRAEIFIRIVGPKPNGLLWPNLVKFSTSGMEVWIRQISTGDERFYQLDAVDQGEIILDLTGLADKGGFVP